MRFFKFFAMTIAICLLTISSGYAQVSPMVTDVIATPQFFISLLAGVLLAVGFQVLLSALSVAAGISAIGNIQKKANKSSSDSDKNKSSSDSTSTGVKISSGLGAWTMITVSIALFCASLLAVKLSLIGNAIIGITLGLVIWAAFFTTMAYLEVKSVSSLLGTLINTAFAGIKHSMSALQDMFTKSQTSKIEDIAEHTIDKVRREMEDSTDMHAIRDKVDEYVNRMEQTAERSPDYEQIKQDFINILRDVRIEERTDQDLQGKESEIFIKLASEQPNLSKQDVKKMGNVFKQAQQAVKAGDTKEDKAKKVAAQFTPASETDIDSYVQKIEDYLRSTDRNELDPEGIRQDIEDMIQNPSHAQSIVNRRAGQMDRGTLVALLEKQKKMDHAKAEKVVSFVEQAIGTVANKADQSRDQASHTVSDATSTVKSQLSEGEQKANQKTEQAGSGLEARLRDYLSSTQRPEIQYDSLKWDIERIMNDPKSSPEIVRSRLQRFNKETFISLLTANDKISRSDIEQLANKVDESRNSIIETTHKIEAETSRRLEQARQESLHQAENVRKTAAAAAWWLFGTAIVSGLASAAGGLVAIL
ncbi:uncharacterized membrane protein YciS (DUF1049 family) [Catalinimonas alkaloidigena]|uniref:hypothetical protein n=1 Tax=Catalinimonas alkaloidigena TaxID=1075417 RepID=UPI0024075F7C|nr:hypothetical protein [Catalinimonas alkaloidigena]MDF9798423.1 uncharacterized membrane protein YciS (DUF1049 family) [Catalinimonas alkaloidigena]